MNVEELKAKVWISWPFIALIVAVVIIAAVILRTQSEGVSETDVEPYPYGSIERLTRLSAFKQAYLTANGGEERLKALQTVRASGVMESGGASRPFFSLKKRPDRALLTFEFENHSLTFGVNGEEVWQRVTVPGQAPEFTLKTGDEAEALLALGEFFDPLMNVVLFGKGTIEGIEKAEWEGEEFLKLEFVRPDGVRSAAFLDPRTMHPAARLEYFADMTVRKVLFSDFRSVGGMQEPFRTETYLNDELQNRLLIERAESNIGAIPSLFEFPESAPTPASEVKEPAAESDSL